MDINARLFQNASYVLSVPLRVGRTPQAEQLCAFFYTGVNLCI
jgi:hypothetical protein